MSQNSMSQNSISQNTTVLNSVSWRDLCPWLMLARSIGVALRPSIVFIAFVGLLITPLGWSMAGLFLAKDDQIGQPFPMEQAENYVQVRTQIPKETFWRDTFKLEEWYTGQGPLTVFGKLYKGHIQILNPVLNIRQCTYYFLGSVWMILVWSVMGAMICRIAAAQFTRDERIGIFEAFDFVRRRLVSVWTSSFVPLSLILLFAIPFVLVGLMMRADFLLVLVGIGWFMVALIGLAMAIILIPLFFGFPLLWPAIATEGSDAFEAVSRSYSYPTQRPYHYVFYWLVVLVVGFLAAFVASLLADKTIEFTRWGTSWGAGFDRVGEVVMAGEAEAPGATEEGEEAKPAFTFLGAGAKSINFWEQGIRILTVGFNYGFFFVAMTGMYLLLRKDNDFMELDELHVDPDEEVLPLPQLQTTEPPLPKPLADADQAPEKEIIGPPTNDGPPESNADSEVTPSEDEDDGELRVEDE